MDRWKCPDCRAWVSPEVKEHRCDDNGAGSPARLDPQPPVITPGWAVYGMTWCSVCQCWYFPNAMVPHQHPYPIWIAPYSTPFTTTTIVSGTSGNPISTIINSKSDLTAFSGATYHVTG